MTPPPAKVLGPSRREFLSQLGGGLGGVALAWFLDQNVLRGGGTPLPAAVPDFVPRAGSQFRPRAKRVIQLFMNGGASPMDTFDYKPELIRRHGQKFDPGDGRRVEAATSVPGMVMKSPFEWRQHGQCGRWVSSVLPCMAESVDDLAFLMSMTSRTNVHGPASYLMNTGSLLSGFPCMGSWLSYGLGRITDSLPSFVVLPDPRGLPYNQKGNFSSGFLPVGHQGTVFNTSGNELIAHLHAPSGNPLAIPAAEREGRELLASLNRRHQAAHETDLRLEGRIEAYELAARMQLSAPEAMDLEGETPATRQLYGMDQPVTADYGRRCLLARRLIERGVRFVQVWSGAGGASGNWDNHGSIARELPPIAAATDRPIAGLLRDLRARGLLEDTLVLWNTEFGRMPFTQGSDGRDHNGGTFVGWMAGAGVRAGVAYGESDPWAWQAGPGAVSTYDFHATVLHLLGLDHTKVAVYHNGVSRRLTDVHGEVIRAVLA